MAFIRLSVALIEDHMHFDTACLGFAQGVDDASVGKTVSLHQYRTLRMSDRLQNQPLAIPAR